MGEWSRGKKAAAIAIVSVFGLIGLGGTTEPQKNNAAKSTTIETTEVQGTSTSAPEPVPIAAPVPEPTPPPPPPVVLPPPASVPTPQPASNCVVGYSPCIAPGSDVDCASGSGNGPRYVSGPVYITGSDPYDLDRDGDGIGCE